jgi:hypothetical protein
MTSILEEVDEVHRLDLHHAHEPPLPGHVRFDERDSTAPLRLLADDLLRASLDSRIIISNAMRSSSESLA